MLVPMRRRPPSRQPGRIVWPAVAIAVTLGLGSAYLSPPHAAILAVVGALAVVSLLYPEIGLALVAVAVPFGEVVPWVQVTIGPLNGGLGEILMGFVLLGWVGRVLVRRERITLGSLVWPMAAFLGAEALSAAFAPPLSASAKELARWLQVIAIYLATVNLVRKPETRRLLLGAIFAAGAAQAALGAYQFFARSGPTAYQFDRFLRAYGTFGQPNPFAGYLEMVVPLGLALVFVWRPRKRGWLWWLALAASSMGSAAIVMSLSRGAWLGMAVGLVVGAVVATRRGWVVAASAFVTAACVFAADTVHLLPQPISDRLSQATGRFRLFDTRGVVPTSANYAVVERMAHWQAGWEMFLAHPLLGVGPGHYALAYPQYAILPYWTLALGHAHNIYINVAAETGLIGLVAYLAMVGSWFALVLSRARGLAAREPTGLSRAVVVGVLGCLAAVAVHNTFDDLYVHMMNVQIGLLLGLASVAVPGFGAGAGEQSRAGAGKEWRGPQIAARCQGICAILAPVTLPGRAQARRRPSGLAVTS